MTKVAHLYYGIVLGERLTQCGLTVIYTYTESGMITPKVHGSEDVVFWWDSITKLICEACQVAYNLNLLRTLGQ
jgi:hypothetical protein